MLSVVMLSGIILSAVMLSIVMLIVIMLNVIILCVIMHNFAKRSVIMLRVVYTEWNDIESFYAQYHYAECQYA